MSLMNPIEEGMPSNDPLPRTQPVEHYATDPPIVYDIKNYEVSNQDLQSEDVCTQQPLDAARRWTTRNRAIAVLAGIVMTCVLIGAIVFATTSGRSTGQPSFSQTWNTDKLVAVGSRTEGYSTSSLESCQSQCTSQNAESGIFLPAHEIQVGSPNCFCSFGTMCWDSTIQIQGGQVFSKSQVPNLCQSPFCEGNPDDVFCRAMATDEATSVQTPSPTPVIPSPTLGPAQTSEPRSMASLYQVQWEAGTDPEGLCEEPTPGLLASCGVGGLIDIVSATSTVECDYVGDRVAICTASYDESDFWALGFGCIGKTETSRTANVTVIPDGDVECSENGAAWSYLFLSQRCPQDDPNVNRMRCHPGDTIQSNEDGNTVCYDSSSCEDASCELSSPLIASSVSDVEESCLFAVSERNPPQPSPAPVAAKAQRTVYQAEWYGPKDAGNACELPTPGLRVFCGEGGKISVLATTNSTQCSIQSDQELTCTARADEQDFWAVVYSCTGTGTSAWTTRVESIADDSVQCKAGGSVGTRLYLGQGCRGQSDRDFNKTVCDPDSALKKNPSTGNKNCLTFVSCPGGSDGCILTTPDVSAFIPEGAISSSCLFDPI